VPIKGSNQNVTLYVLRFSTPVHDSEGTFAGYLMLSLDLRELRDILSTYSGPNAPISTSGEEARVRTLFFDRDGWMLFQSEAPDAGLAQRSLGTDAVRAGFTGDFGRPGFNTAFRPSPEHINYWNMVSDVQEGKSGQLPLSENSSLWSNSQMRVERVSYVPVTFSPASQETIILGGLAVLDTSFTTTRTGVQLMGIYVGAFVGGMLLLGLSLWWLARQTGHPRFRPLAEVLACDVVTLHVPLTKEGQDATYHLADEAFIRAMRPGSILINSSRGPVADGAAIKRALADGHLRACVLDVWEGEPNVDAELLEQVFIGTPHIAGYSFDGKVNGTRMIYEAACRFLGLPALWDPAPLLPAPECPRVDVDAQDPRALLHAVRAVYDIRGNDAAMRRILAAPVEERAKLFDTLRKEYPRRREFSNTRACVTPGDAVLKSALAGIGFRVDA